MTKRIILIVLAGLLIITSGCAKNIDKNNNKITETPTETPAETPNETPNETPGTDAEQAPSLGGVSLGDSSEKVADILGDKYTETAEPDTTGIIGEDTTVWEFEKGIIVSIGQTSKKVLRISSTNPDFKTDLGIKAGDNAKTVFEAYKDKYEEAKSRHSDDILEGWYLIGDGAVIIFDFDKSDDTLVNNKVSSDSVVEEIILAYWEHFN
jgi:hypothetical protein